MKTEDNKPPTLTPKEADPRLVAVEVNMLRFPFFSLYGRGLSTLNGIECSGHLTREGQTHTFTFKAYRSTATMYPGPLARQAHLAFLDILAEQRKAVGGTVANPVCWGWRDLCRRLGVTCSGRTVENLKDAILSVKGLLIRSEYAIYDRAGKKAICTRENALGVYDQVVFHRERTPAGEIAETNQLWLSAWVVANLNAFYTAPLDFKLWQRLEARSSVASRLYEYLMLNFYSGQPVFTVNYSYLAQMIPIQKQSRVSKAREKLDPAFRVLQDEGLLTGVDWTVPVGWTEADRREKIAQLAVRRGPGFRTAPGQAGPPEELPTLEVREVRDEKAAEYVTVSEFYKAFTGREFSRPTPKELDLAAELIRQYGAAKVLAATPLVAAAMRKKFPDARSFLAARRYFPDVVSGADKRAKAGDVVAAEAKRRTDQTTAVEGGRDKWNAAWAALPEPEKEEIRRRVKAANPTLARMPALLENLYVSELAKSQAAK